MELADANRRAVQAHLERIDQARAQLEATARDGARALELIGRHSIDWPVDRLALLDRLILTLATSELLMDEAPPVAVVLDEAVELAKTYSTDGSPAFVNGVLSAIADDVAHD
jgi:N utilization substance protein B